MLIILLLHTVLSFHTLYLYIISTLSNKINSAPSIFKYCIACHIQDCRAYKIILIYIFLVNPSYYDMMLKSILILSRSYIYRIYTICALYIHSIYSSYLHVISTYSIYISYVHHVCISYVRHVYKSYVYIYTSHSIYNVYHIYT